MSVAQNELTSSPAIPKSHSLISPARFMRILDGLTSMGNVMEVEVEV